MLKFFRPTQRLYAYTASINKGDTNFNKHAFNPQSGTGGLFRGGALSEGVYLNGLEYFTDARSYQYRSKGGTEGYRYQNYPEIHRKWQQPIFKEPHRTGEAYLIDCDGLDLPVAGAVIAQAMYGYHRHDYYFRFFKPRTTIVVNCARLVLTGNEWEETPYFRAFKTSALSQARMHRAKQLFQQDPRKLLWTQLIQAIPSEMPEARKRAVRQLHLFNTAEHPYEHWYPTDMTGRILLSNKEDLNPSAFQGALAKRQAATFVTKNTKKLVAMYGGGGEPISEIRKTSAFDLQGRSNYN